MGCCAFLCFSLLGLAGPGVGLIGVRSSFQDFVTGVCLSKNLQQLFVHIRVPNGPPLELTILLVLFLFHSFASFAFACKLSRDWNPVYVLPRVVVFRPHA